MTILIVSLLSKNIIHNRFTKKNSTKLLDSVPKVLLYLPYISRGVKIDIPCSHGASINKKEKGVIVTESESHEEFRTVTPI